LWDFCHADSAIGVIRRFFATAQLEPRLLRLGCQGWLESLRDARLGERSEALILIQEAHELTAIFTSSRKTAERNQAARDREAKEKRSRGRRKRPDPQ
jgi:hypothetical protein